MKKFLALIIFAILLVPSLAFARPLNVLSMGVEKNGDEKVAIDRLALNATAHALAFIIPISPDPNSDFVKIVKAHYKEITSNTKVIAKRKDGAAIFVTGEVMVDFDKLRQIVQTQIKGLQEANTDDMTAFFVRIVGIENDNLKARAYQDVLTTYQFVFENLGFKSTDEDIFDVVSGGGENESFEDYCRRVNSAIENDGRFGYAVIGEINLSKSAEGATGVMYESIARLQARRYDTSATGNGLAGSLIFQFDDDYKLKGRDDNVGFFALRKAALNSSRALAEHTLDYWKNHH